MYIAKSQIDWLQAVPIVHRFSDKEISRFARREGRASTETELRVFPWWPWDEEEVHYYMPWKKNLMGQWDWNQPEFRYDENFKRLQKILFQTELYPKDENDARKANIPIRYSFLDQCANRGWIPEHMNPWKNNVHGPKGMYATDSRSIQAIEELWIDRLWDMGVRLFDGGNELNAHRLWVKNVYTRYIRYLLNKGAKPPFSYSGSQRTGHDIRGWVGDTIGVNVMCHMLHGQMLPELIPGLESFSRRFYYGLSCDGLNTKNMNIPERRKGIITDDGKYQDSAVREHMKSVAKLVTMLKRGGRVRKDQVRFWGHLIRGIDNLQSPNNIRQHEDVTVTWRVPLHVYGVDLRRKPL